MRGVKEFIRELRPYLWTSALFFALGIVIGLAIILYVPAHASAVERAAEEFIEMFRDLSPANLFALIFLNNAVKTFAVIVFGVFFGLIPVAFLVINGIVLAVVMAFSAQVAGTAITLAAILPHAVIELPAAIAGAASGIMLGHRFVKRLSGAWDKPLTNDLLRAGKFFAFVLAPLLLFAAFIEAFITPLVISFVAGI